MDNCQDWEKIHSIFWHLSQFADELVEIDWKPPPSTIRGRISNQYIGVGSWVDEYQVSRPVEIASRRYRSTVLFSFIYYNIYDIILC